MMFSNSNKVTGVSYHEITQNEQLLAIPECAVSNEIYFSFHIG